MQPINREVAGSSPAGTAIHYLYRTFMTNEKRIQKWKKWKFLIKSNPKKYRISHYWSSKDLYYPKFQEMKREYIGPYGPRVTRWKTIEEMPSWDWQTGKEIGNGFTRNSKGNSPHSDKNTKECEAPFW